MVPALYWPLLGSMYRGLKEHLKKNPGLIEVTSKYRTRTGLSLYIEPQLDVVNKGFRGGCDDLHGDILLPMPASTIPQSFLEGGVSSLFTSDL